MSVQVMIYAYLAISASMIIFNIAYAAVNRHDENSARKSDKKIRKFIQKQVLKMKDNEDISTKHLKKLYHKCKNIWNFAALDDELSSLSIEHKEEVNKYVEKIVWVFVKLSTIMKKKNPIQKAHFSYMVEKYNENGLMPISTMMPFIIEMVQSENFYCRQNALRVLYSYGNVDAMVEALSLLSNSKYAHHESLIVDGLLSFKGDREALISKLFENRKNYNLKIQVAILNFIRFGSGLHKEELFELLLDESENDEIRFSALRYFGKYPYEKARETLLNYAKNSPDRAWEYASIAVSDLALYPGEETIKTLKECLSNTNWYVRINAATSLEKFNLTYRELADVLDGKDRYAREVLLYRMDMENFEKQALKEKETL